ncbi:DnaQ family exonuclease/DinG family helicase, putative [Desulfitobacterium dichloroeliminans LMG P-21439]|uniref:3'-5' exonuclease DinG n=1 Tax=Desulfitobacterium dichloroeliminans (strain LMG P-21439 / DCA1) TaxID=871963 RepID=L0F6W6_DESDL|nr:helicase C-terminal domain-containing protein [Desulfitobacterium dichloroeliminans]AGA69549.1 DnaQ family exonuclease/DinG family helicase, putative [Desulfitobacterium dichloroeliminans LMG P-21439]
MIAKKIVVIDIETTGLDIYKDEIIEFAALSIDEGKDPEIFSVLVSPKRQVPERILRLTGLSFDELKQAQPIESYCDIILNLFRDAIIVGHNVNFDLGFVERALNIHFENPIWDTLEIARVFFPNMNNYRLADLVKRLDLEPLEKAHRAMNDAQAAWNLLKKCWEKGMTLDASFYQRALPLAGGSKLTGFLKELDKTIRKEFPDRLIRTDLVLYDQELGLFEPQEEEAPIPEDIKWIDQCFTPGGILESNLKGYESRPGQLHMAKAVAKALATSTHCVAEAGTGTGKSYAYLIPSLWWARKTNKKVVVATHTIPLQEQLYKKDLPILSQILPFSFHGVLLKGKGNYLCLKRWLTVQSHFTEYDYGERLALLSVMIWLRETSTGDWQEVSQIPSLSRLWGNLNAEEESCVPGKCPQANRCYMLHARKRAEEADLIIVNHSLLFSDIKTENNILPEFHELVIDEAHHLHQSALEQLGNEISLEQISRVLNLLSRSMAGSFYGNVKARAQLWERILSESLWNRFRGHLERLPEACDELFLQTEEVFASFEQILGNELSYRLTAHSQNESWWQTITVQIENFQGRLKAIVDLLKAMYNLLEPLDDEDAASLAYELSGRIRNLEEVRDCFNLAMQVEKSTRVSWLERNNRLLLKTSPVDVSTLLKEKLFKPLNSAVLTSATLSIANSFQHFLQENGLGTDTATLIVDSPFDYDQQMQFIVVKDLIEPNHSNLFDSEKIALFISEVTERMKGRTLVLFTSHQFLREIHHPLSRYLGDSGIELLAQGIDGGRHALLDAFINNPKSVLLGANSFWEGIDIPGDKLSCVILIKLPFGPPNRPLIAARSEYLEAQGKNAFYEFLLPEAVLRFKQGFGRLIRSKSDRGLVILCDNRVIEKRYGRIFLNSLPVKTHVRCNETQILDHIDNWLDEMRQKELLL